MKKIILMLCALNVFSVELYCAVDTAEENGIAQQAPEVKIVDKAAGTGSGLLLPAAVGIATSFLTALILWDGLSVNENARLGFVSRWLAHSCAYLSAPTLGYIAFFVTYLASSGGGSREDNLPASDSASKDLQDLGDLQSQDIWKELVFATGIGRDITDAQFIENIEGLKHGKVETAVAMLECTVANLKNIQQKMLPASTPDAARARMRESMATLERRIDLLKRVFALDPEFLNTQREYFAQQMSLDPVTQEKQPEPVKVG